MVGIFRDKTEYLLTHQKQEIEFKRNQLISQLDSVRVRNKRLLGDIYIYIAFFFAPFLVMLFSVFVIICGNIGLRIIFMPLTIISAAAFIFLGPFSAYKFGMSLVMYLFNQRGGHMMILGKLYTVYTYKSEESYCLAKLARIDGYLEQITDWMEAAEAGKEVPGEEQLEYEFEQMDLDVHVKVATVKDPITSRFGMLAIPAMFFSAFLVCALIWAVDLWSVQKVYASLGEFLF